MPDENETKMIIEAAKLIVARETAGPDPAPVGAEPAAQIGQPAASAGVPAAVAAATPAPGQLTGQQLDAMSRDEIMKLLDDPARKAEMEALLAAEGPK